MTIWLLLAGVVAVTAAAVAVSAFVGNRIAALREVPRMARMVVTLSGIVLAASIVALALGGPGPDEQCSGPTRDGVAAVIAVLAVPSIVVAAAVGLGAIFGNRRSSKLCALALAAAVAAGIVDWFALVHSVHICLN